MTSHLRFELFMRQMRTRALSDQSRQYALGGMPPDEGEDVGAVRLSRIEAAMKETRAARPEE